MNAAESVQRNRSVLSYLTIPPPFLMNEANKKQNGISREKIQLKPSAKFCAIKGKNASYKACDPICRESEQTTISDLKNISYYFDNASNSVGKTQAKCNSLTGFEKNGSIERAIYPQISYTQNTSSITSFEMLNFNNSNLRHQKSGFDYLKEFNLIRSGGISKELPNSRKDEGAFSLVPKISTSESIITLPRKRYNRVVLSVKDSKAVLKELKENHEKHLNEMTMNIEFENADAYSTKESGTSRCRENNKCLSDTWLLKNKNYILVVKKPVKIKCIDEVSNKMKDIIIYSDDFLKDILKERGNSAKKKEICENILKESTVYQGKGLRIITDAEKYWGTLCNSRKSQGDIKSSAAQMSKQSSTKVSEHNTQIRKNTSNIPPCSQSRRTFSTSNKIKKETLVEQDVPDISSKTFVIESADVNFTQTDGGSDIANRKRIKNIEILKRKNTELLLDINCTDSDMNCTDISSKTFVIESADVNFTQTDIANRKRIKNIEILKRENTEFKYINKGKSRTALKRINITSIIESSFSYYFHFYAKLGRFLKSGATISKKNSTSWMKQCGIIYDTATQSMAENCFMRVACSKYVLNKYDYVKCLKSIAKNRHMLLVELLDQMMSVDLYSVKKSNAKQKSNQPEEPTNCRRFYT